MPWAERWGRGALGALLVFFLAFIASSLLWCFICAGFIAGLRRAVNLRWTRIIEAASGAALIIMGALLAAEAL